MQKKTYRFSSKKVAYYFDANFAYLEKLVDKSRSVIITDENLFASNQLKFSGWKTIVIKAGEQFKVQATVDEIINKLIQIETDRKSFLIGVGGGVVTDITGYVASVYMRGIRFGFVPSSILGMVDASVGGKNGIDVGVYKNLVGVINQPEFLLYDISLLKSLPEDEWVNGFAEIIKHACILDSKMFDELKKRKLSYYRNNKAALSKLIKRNVMIKSSVVQKDEFENGDRRLLNFGHTVGHAIENVYSLPHGRAISIGMVIACIVSEELGKFKGTKRVVDLLTRYQLPVKTEMDSRKIVEILKMDKKKVHQSIKYVMLNKIGKGVVQTIPVDLLEKMLHSIAGAR
ncbi:MAG: 3-dehydroquinate synthase [Bacteroidetes bacterium]|nr:3-dehydroquinate synthase [Bacteroidota bacterium]